MATRDKQNADLGITSVQFHGVQVEIGGIDRFVQMFPRQLETFPNTREMVMDVKEDTSLPARISAEALKLIWTGSERRDGPAVAFPKPVVGPPIQKREDPSHLFLEKENFFVPAGPAGIGF